MDIHEKGGTGMFLNRPSETNRMPSHIRGRLHSGWASGTGMFPARHHSRIQRPARYMTMGRLKTKPGLNLKASSIRPRVTA